MADLGLADRLSGCLEHERYRRSGASRDAGVLIALTDEPAPRLLLTRRNPHLPMNPGELSFPGGKAEPADADLLTTALRESYEEVALDRSQFRYCGSLTRRETLMGIGVVAFAGVVPPDIELTAYPGEVDELIWVPLSYFAQPAELRVDCSWHQGRERRLARYHWRGYTIWGMTAAFIVELANRLCNAGLDQAVYRESGVVTEYGLEMAEQEQSQ